MGRHVRRVRESESEDMVIALWLLSHKNVTTMSGNVRLRAQWPRWEEDEREETEKKRMITQMGKRVYQMLLKSESSNIIVVSQ